MLIEALDVLLHFLLSLLHLGLIILGLIRQRYFSAINVLLHPEGLFCELEDLEGTVLLESERRLLNGLELGDEVDNTTSEEDDELLIVVVDGSHNSRVDVVQGDDLTNDVLEERLEGLSAVGEQSILLLNVVVTIDDHEMAVKVGGSELIGEKRRIVTQSVVSIRLPGIRRHVQVGAVKIIEELSEAVGTDGSEGQEVLNLGTFIERVDKGKVVIVGRGVVVVDDLLVVGLYDRLSSQMLRLLQLILLVGDKLISSGLFEITGECLVGLDRGDTEHHDESGSNSQHSDEAKFEWLAGAISTR